MCIGILVVVLVSGYVVQKQHLIRLLMLIQLKCKYERL